MLVLGCIAGIVFGIEMISFGFGMIYCGTYLWFESYERLVDYVIEKRKK